jgi:hypothetical protein
MLINQSHHTQEANHYKKMKKMIDELHTKSRVS